ncbi:MAG: nucleoside triphosphate pyrophosphohydrolase, partial [Bacteroidetes bacterium]
MIAKPGDKNYTVAKLEKKKEAFARLLQIMDDLRENCPWDRKQTFQSLRNL